MLEPLHEDFLRAICDMHPDTKLDAFAAKAMATELLEARKLIARWESASDKAIKAFAAVLREGQ